MALKKNGSAMSIPAKISIPVQNFHLKEVIFQASDQVKVKGEGLRVKDEGLKLNAERLTVDAVFSSFSRVESPVFSDFLSVKK